jgi:hypothetical protein
MNAVKCISVTGFVMAHRQLSTGLSPKRPGFHSRPVHMELVVDKAAAGQVFLQVLQFSLTNIIPPMLPH